MAKNISLTLCLLTGVLVAGSLPLAAIAAPVPLAAEKQTASNVTLSLNDLPPGFQELPPEYAGEIATKLEVIRQQVGQQSLKPEKFFAYINPQNFQLVFGLIGKLTDLSDRESFDASLEQMQLPEFQEQITNLLREQLKTNQGMELLEYKILPDLDDLADASSGMTLAVNMQGQPLRMDIAAFRRNKVGAFTVVAYLNGKVPQIAVGDVARKLDGRILKPKTSANHRGQAGVR